MAAWWLPRSARRSSSSSSSSISIRPSFLALLACLALFFLLILAASIALTDPGSLDVVLRAMAGDPPHTPASRSLEFGHSNASSPFPFTDLLDAYRRWDAEVGCASILSLLAAAAHKHHNDRRSSIPSLQSPQPVACSDLKQQHVTVHIKEWTWIPDNLQNLYSCDCGLTCMWTKSPILADDPDVLLYESSTPPRQRHIGEPLRAYMDLEAGRQRSGFEDIFIGYHAGDTVQATYAGASFHIQRSYFTSPIKRQDVLVYWSSSRCLPNRDKVAAELLSYLPHHSFGKCLNNVDGANAILTMYPRCTEGQGDRSSWSYHLHCAMSHYKFVLAIENTWTESYVTEKLFYALDAGAIPIYFGAPNVMDLVPPGSIIQGSKFDSMESLAKYVKQVANDPVLYSGYHAWRRCGVMGNYYQTRAVSLDSLPCRLCSIVSRAGGKAATRVS